MCACGNWWSNGVTLPARRSCKDHLHPCACPVVPGRGFEPRSPALQTGAFTRLAFRAASVFREELIEDRHGKRLIGADAGNRNRTFGVALRNSTFELHPRVWWEVERIELPAAKGRRLQRRDGTSRPSGTSRELVWPRGPCDEKVRGFSLTRVPPIHPRSAEVWWKTEVLIPTPRRCHPASNGRRALARFVLHRHNLAEG